MKIPFGEACTFMYRPKTSYEQYEKNELNNLLEQMYKVAIMSGTLGATDPLPIFNVSYAIAVVMANTPNIALKNINEDILYLVVGTCQYTHLRGANYNGDVILCKWMAYCILHLQENMTEDLNIYLDGFRQSLQETLKYASGKAKAAMAFAGRFPDMIDTVKERFHTDLYPSAIEVDCLTDAWWDRIVSKLSDEDFLKMLTFYRTKEEQHAFLDWAMDRASESPDERTRRRALEMM